MSGGLGRPTEADTCREYVLPNLRAAGWREPWHIGEQRYFTDGRIFVTGRRAQRRPGKKADYLLFYRPDIPIAVVEAKRSDKKPGDGLQKTMEYAEILGLKFAYATNGKGIVEHDYTTGCQRNLDGFPPPDELWRRYREAAGLTDEKTAQELLQPLNRELRNARGDVREPRYYQEMAIRLSVQAVLRGQKRILLTMATGTGKTFTAVQIAWKLWKTERKRRILYLADRNILVDQPIAREFSIFGDALWKIQGEAKKGREIYFALYQALAEDERRPGLYKEYPRDYFDLIIVDECHRGSARDESRWREILEYFEPATQVGMTATPLRKENRDTYQYFGDPLYIYTLRQGIADGFLAPYKVYRVIPSPDAAGWRPSAGELDRFGREIPDGLYETKDFERTVSLLSRTKVVARHLTDYLKRTNRFDKTVVFCVDQEHAENMRGALHEANEDLARDHPHYVARVTAEEGKVGRGHLDDFVDPEKRVPVILTTSQLLTTGVDIPTCKNVVFFKPVGSMVEFKQILGRGTRVNEYHGKLFFTILDYAGATRLFADPAFDGDPEGIREERLDPDGKVTMAVGDDSGKAVWRDDLTDIEPPVQGGEPPAPRKYYVDGGVFRIAVEVEQDLDPTGKKLRVMRYVDYTAREVRRMYASADEFRARWTDAEQRAAILAALADRGIELEALAQAAGQPEADPFDLLVHVAWNGPLRSRRERVEKLRQVKANVFVQYSPEALAVLDEILELYAAKGVADLTDLRVLEIPPVSNRGNVVEIARLFGGREKLHKAVADLQSMLYAA